MGILTAFKALLPNLGLIQGVFLLAVSYVLVKLLLVGKRPKGLPPGPQTLPLLGNLHQMPTDKVHIAFQELGKKYGDIYTLMVGSTPMIMIQSAKIAKELLDKRGAIYSSRPSLYIFNDVGSRGLRMVASPYNSMWKMNHRINYRILNPKVARSYGVYQLLESRQMLVDILEDPGQHKRHLQRFSNSISCQMVYGFRTLSWSDPKLQSVVQIFEEICDVGVGIPARILDCYPIFQKIPRSLLPVCRQAMDIERRTTSLFLDRWLEGKKQTLSGSIMPCHVASLTQVQKEEGFSDEAASYMSGDLVEAGSSTTADQLLGFLMAMVTHRDVQKRAQQEIDAVIGTDRLPTLDDIDSLPYIRGCVKETLRWAPGITMLIPHSPLKDDIYEGHKIPAGSSIVLNVWALNMDPENFPDPRRFDPSRYQEEKRSEREIAVGNTSAYYEDGSKVPPRHNYLFGAGRRLCQGIEIAERSLFLAMACLLWSFDISCPNPESIDTEDLRGGLAAVPPPFECNIKPRDAKRVEVMRREWQRMQDDFLDPVTKQWMRVPNELRNIKMYSNAEAKIDLGY
ncbi:putative cytochrome P450 [Naviculisporaceae sp. PSN 640]